MQAGAACWGSQSLQQTAAKPRASSCPGFQSKLCALTAAAPAWFAQVCFRSYVVSSVSMLALQAFYPFLPIAHARTAQPIEASSASPARAAMAAMAAMAARAQGTCSHPARQGMIVYLSSVGFVPGSKAKHCSQVLGCKAANIALELLLHQN